MAFVFARNFEANSKTHTMNNPFQLSHPTWWVLLPLLGLLLFSNCKKDAENAPDDKPFIESLELKDGKLSITGSFGDDPGADNRTVIVNDQTLPDNEVFTWGESNIIALFDKAIPDEIAVEVISKGQKSNRKILTIKSKLKITYLQVWEEYSWLYIYGDFGADPGPGKRSITVKGVPVLSVESWTPHLIACTIPRQVTGSYGEVVVSKGPNESTSRILYRWNLRLNYLFPQSGLSGTMTEEAQFHLRIRGDVGEMPAPNLYIPNDEGQAFLYCFCDYKMSGAGHSTYDGCNHVDVEWVETLGDIGLLPNNSGDPTGQSYFQASITALRDGFDEGWEMDGYEMKLKLDVWNATTAFKTYTSCDGHTSTTTDPQMIDFVVFDDKPITFNLAGTTIQGDTLEQHDVASTAGFIWDATNYPANLVTVRLGWKATEAEW